MGTKTVAKIAPRRSTRSVDSDPGAKAIEIFQKNVDAIIKARGINGQEKIDLEMLAGIRAATDDEIAEAKERLDATKAGGKLEGSTLTERQAADITAIDELRSDREWANAILTVHREGGFRIPSVNPFVQDTGSSDTVTYVTAALKYLSRMIPGDEGVRSDKECQFGQYCSCRRSWKH